MVQKRNITIILLFLFIGISSHSQKNIRLISQWQERMDSAYHYLRSNPFKAQSNAINAYDIAKKIKDSSKTSESSLLLGTLFRLNGKLKESEIYLMLAENFARQDTLKAKIYKERGITKKQQSRFDQAIDYYLRAEQIYYNEKDSINLAAIKNNIGRLYYAMHDFEKAFQYYKDALHLKTNFPNSTSLGITYHNLGMVYEAKKKLDSAVYYYRKGLSIFKKENDAILIAYGSSYLGNIFTQKDSALWYLNFGYDIRKKLKLESDIIESEYFLGNFYYKNDNYIEALRLYQQAYEKASTTQKFEYAYNISSKMAELFLRKNNYEKALFYEREASKWQDSLYFQEKKVKDLGYDFRLRELNQEHNLSNLKLKNKAQEQEIERGKLKLENERQFKILMFVIVGFISIFLFITYYFLRIRKQNIEQLRIQNKLIEQKSRENEILVREVHHRVKNNLQSILSLVRIESRKLNTDNPKEIISSIENRILHIAAIHDILYKQDDLMQIHLNDYFKTISDHLLNLHPVNNLQFQIKGDITVTADQALYIGQLFSELFINSCKHAFENTSSPEIHVALSEQAGRFQFIYSDNGKGFESKPEKTHSGFGLKLIQSHLKKLNGEMKTDSENGYYCIIEIENNG